MLNISLCDLMNFVEAAVLQNRSWPDPDLYTEHISSDPDQDTGLMNYFRYFRVNKSLKNCKNLHNFKFYFMNSNFRTNFSKKSARVGIQIRTS
jgi:hypothetical protein